MNDDARTKIRKAAESAFATIGFRADWVGRRYINLLRCSGIDQADTSPDGQKEVNDAYAAFQQMAWAGDDVYAEGVSGSQTFNREDFEEILERKRTLNDFDTVIVFEYGRATRGGNDDNARLIAIRRDLQRLNDSADHRPPTPQEAMAVVTERLNTLPSDWRSLPYAELKLLLSGVIEDCHIDLATFGVSFSICLPVGATRPVPRSADDVRVSFTSAWSFESNTNRKSALSIDRMACEHDAKAKCHRCQRIRAAA